MEALVTGWCRAEDFEVYLFAIESEEGVLDYVLARTIAEAIEAWNAIDFEHGTHIEPRVVARINLVMTPAAQVRLVEVLAPAIDLKPEDRTRLIDALGRPE